MNELEQKKIIVPRIISHLNPVPADAVNDLMKQPLKDLEVILERLATKREQDQIQQDVQTQIDEMREASKKDGAWAHCLLKTRLNNKVLADTEANRQMMESLLQPHETPSSEIYATLAKQFPQKFAWSTPRPIQTDQEREAEFKKICREHWLSECDANRELHKKGVSVDAWAGCSSIERAQFQEEALRARQDYLIHHASPDELKAEANYQFQSEHAAAVKADVERREKFVADAQRGNYPVMPQVDSNGESMNAAFFRRLSTVDYPRFKNLVKRFGSAQVTERLRTS